VGDSGDVWETTDLGTAGYVKMRGLKLLGATQARGRWTFRFADPESAGRQLQVDYSNSESRRHDAEVKTLKKLCYDSGNGTGSGQQGRRGRSKQWASS